MQIHPFPVNSRQHFWPTEVFFFRKFSLMSERWINFLHQFLNGPISRSIINRHEGTIFISHLELWRFLGKRGTRSLSVHGLVFLKIRCVVVSSLYSAFFFYQDCPKKPNNRVWVRSIVASIADFIIKRQQKRAWLEQSKALPRSSDKWILIDDGSKVQHFIS